jgi:hypothetical protein
MSKKTGAGTHRATQRGYAVDPTTKAGVLVEAGEMVPGDQVVSKEWMEPIKSKDRALAQATEEALDPHPKNPDLTALSKPALEALATERGIGISGLSKADLVTAITAARANDAG